MLIRTTSPQTHWLSLGPKEKRLLGFLLAAQHCRQQPTFIYLLPGLNPTKSKGKRFYASSKWPHSKNEKPAVSLMWEAEVIVLRIKKKTEREVQILPTFTPPHTKPVSALQRKDCWIICFGKRLNVLRISFLRMPLLRSAVISSLWCCTDAAFQSSPDWNVTLCCFWNTSEIQWQLHSFSHKFLHGV